MIENVSISFVDEFNLESVTLFTSEGEDFIEKAVNFSKVCPPHLRTCGNSILEFWSWLEKEGHIRNRGTFYLGKDDDDGLSDCHCVISLVSNEVVKREETW